MAKKRNGNPNDPGTFFVNTGRGSFPVTMDSQMHRDLYNSGRLMTYDPQRDEYVAPNLPEFAVTAKRNKSFLEEWGDKIVQESQGSGPAGTIFGATMNAGSSLAQLALMKLLTGKTQRPSEAMDVQNPYGGMAVDAVLDPLNALGGFAAKGNKLLGMFGKRGVVNASDNLMDDLGRAVNTPNNIYGRTRVPVHPQSDEILRLSQEYWNDPKTIAKYNAAETRDAFNYLRKEAVNKYRAAQQRDFPGFTATGASQSINTPMELLPKIGDYRNASAAIQYGTKTYTLPSILESISKPILLADKNLYPTTRGFYDPQMQQAFVKNLGKRTDAVKNLETSIGVHENASHAALRKDARMPFSMRKALSQNMLDTEHLKAIANEFPNDPRWELAQQELAKPYLTTPAEIHARILQTKLHAGKFPQKANLTWDDFQKAADDKIIREDFLWLIKDKKEFVRNANKYAAGLPIVPALNNGEAKSYQTGGPISDYKPTKAKDNNVTYYAIPNKNEFYSKEKDLNAFWNFYKTRTDLNGYLTDYGKDEKGEYISLYKKEGNFVKDLLGASTEYYDRIYKSDLTNVEKQRFYDAYGSKNFKDLKKIVSEDPSLKQETQPTTSEQIDWYLNYIKSPMYKKILTNEFKLSGKSEKEVDKEIQNRYTRIKNTPIEETKIHPKGYNFVRGITYLNENNPNEIALETGKPQSVLNYNSPEGWAKYKKGTIQIDPSAKYLDNAIVTHELSHSATQGNKYLTKYAKDLMLNSVNPESKNAKFLDKELNKKYGYLDNPTEVHARLTELKYLMNKYGIYNPSKEKVSKDHLFRALQHPQIRKNMDIDSLMQMLQGKGDPENLMNKIAKVEPNTKGLLS